MTSLQTGRLLLPLANEDDATATARAVERTYGDDADDVTLVAVHVIEKGGGYLDKAPLEKRQEQAEEVFAIVRETLESAGFTVETDLVYDTDVIDALVDAAGEMDATAIVFVPRPRSRLSELLSGSPSYRLVTESSVPVVALPRPNDD